jgi:Ser/Thr protein kinase RdoA (MazF antagonist)
MKGTEGFSVVTKNLIEFAAKNYGFDINDFKIKHVNKWGNPPGEIYAFNKNGRDYIIRFDDVSQPVEYIRKIKSDMDFICYLAENNISVASPLRTIDGEFVISTQDNGKDYVITAFDLVNGQLWDKNDPDKWNDKIFYNWGRTMGDMHRAAKKYQPANERDIPKDVFDNHYWGSFFDCLKVYPNVDTVVQKLLAEIIALPRDADSFGLIHSDMHPDNFFIDGEKINVFDFGDTLYGWFALDAGIALFHALWWGRKDDAGNNFTNAIIGNFVEGYLSSNHLSDFWLSKIPMFMKYRQISAFVPWFFDPDNINDNQKEWINDIENDILFDAIDLKYISDIIEDIRPKQGKVIMLGGCPRTGKTTLAVKLIKSGKSFSKISGDYLGESIDAGLHEYEEISVDKFEFMKLLLEKLVHDAEVYGINSIYDYCSYDFTPEDIEKLPFKDKLDVYFFGFPDIPAGEIRYHIKHYAKPADWISHVSDDYIGEVAEKIYTHNIELKQQCEKYGYRFINTGVGGDRSVILDLLYEEIIERL